MHDPVLKGIDYKMIGGDGQEYGPVSLDELRQWIEEERLDPRSYVWSSAEDRWRPAVEWPELRWDFPAPEPAPPVASVPPVIREVAADSLPKPSGHETIPIPSGAFASSPPISGSPSAGLLPRLGAYVCDWMILTFITAIVTSPWASTLNEMYQAAMAQNSVPNPDIGVMLRFLWISLCIHVPISMAYHVGFNTRFGGTPGKLFLNMRILGPGGSRLTLERACIRFLAEGLCIVSFGMGYLLIALHPNKQGLHDLVAQTRVVHLHR